MPPVKKRYKGKWIKESNLAKIEKAIATMATAKERKKHENSEVKKWEEGRRIVELGTLRENMKCRKCEAKLTLDDIRDEDRFGLLSTFHVVCPHCKVTSLVESGKTYPKSIGDIYCPDVNTKAVLGAMHTGIGCSSLTSLLACLDVPTIPSPLYEKYEKEIGPALEETAKESCKQKQEEEWY